MEAEIAKYEREHPFYHDFYIEPYFSDSYHSTPMRVFYDFYRSYERVRNFKEGYRWDNGYVYDEIKQGFFIQYVDQATRSFYTAFKLLDGVEYNKPETDKEAIEILTKHQYMEGKNCHREIMERIEAVTNP